MSGTSHDPHRRHADRPAEVTDLLLWGLALDVADAHQPEADGGCAILLCAGQPWPCVPWNTAQRALRLARAAPPPADAVGPADDREPLPGWSLAVPPPGVRPPALPRSRRGRAAVPAA